MKVLRFSYRDLKLQNDHIRHTCTFEIPIDVERKNNSFSSFTGCEILFLKVRLNTVLSERSGRDYETIKEDTDRDFYMSPKEAVEYGLIDLVLDKKPGRV